MIKSNVDGSAWQREYMERCAAKSKKKVDVVHEIVESQIETGLARRKRE